MFAWLGLSQLLLAQADQGGGISVGFLLLPIALVVLVVAAVVLSGMRYIPNNRVGIVEKLWSSKGSVPEGASSRWTARRASRRSCCAVAHFGLALWQYRIHKVGLVTVPQGKIGYVYARDGQPLSPSQTIGQVVECNNFQDARAFLVGNGEADDEGGRRGQRGRQRAILREGVYAINIALFVVITEEQVYRLDFQGRREYEAMVGWQNEAQGGRRLRSGRHR